MSEGVANAHFGGKVCDICGDAETERDFFLARADDDDWYFSSGKTCRCLCSGNICFKCLVKNDANELVCPGCVDLKRIPSKNQDWMKNMEFFRSKLRRAELCSGT